MKTTLRVVDDFLPSPLAVRESALKLNNFRKPVEFNGAPYLGVGVNGVPDISKRLAEASGWNSTFDHISFFRLGQNDDESDHWIHADAVPADWASVLYLNPPAECHGGTGLYRHADTQAEWLEDNSLFDFYNKEGKHPDRWELTDFVSMRWNRLVIYRTNRFHARIPLDGWPVDGAGRLILVTFFNAE